MKFRLFFKRLFFILAVIILLLVGSAIYFEINKARLLNDFKIFAQNELSKSTGKDIRLGNIEGGIFSGVTLNKLVIAPKGKDKAIFEADQLIINYRYWDIILGRFDKLKYIRLNSPVLYLNASREDKLSLPGNSLFSWANRVRRISIFIDHGSVAFDKEHTLFSEISGNFLAGKDSLQCSLLKGRGLGADMEFRGVVTKLSQPAGQLDLTLTLKGNLVNGFCRIQDSLSEPLVIGAFNFGEDKKLDFSGKLSAGQSGVLNFKNFLINNTYILNANVDLPRRSGYLTLQDQNKNDILETTLALYSDFSFLSQSKVNHLQLFGHDLLTNLVAMGNWSSDGPKTFMGYMATSGTIIDYNPVNELEVSFQLSEQTFTLSSLKFGHSYEILGNLDLSRPYPLNLNLTITRAQVSDLLIFAKNKIDKDIVSGELNGGVEITGSWLNGLETKGRLEGQNGNIGAIKYESANINLKGRGAVIYFDDSRIFRPEEGKYLALNGFIDLGKLGSSNLLHDLKISSDEKTIIWSGWDITKKPEETKLSFQKSVGHEFKVGFSGFINNEMEDDLKKDKSAVELQYNLSQNRSLKLKLKENEEIIGMEHKIEF